MLNRIQPKKKRKKKKLSKLFEIFITFMYIYIYTILFDSLYSFFELKFK